MTRLFSVILAIVLAGLMGCAANEPVTVRVLTYNMHHGEGMDSRTDLERIAQVIRQSEADLVALQEVDRGVARTDRVDQPASLATLTGLHVVFEKNIDIQGGEYGNAVLSRWPVEFSQNHALPALAGGEQRGALEVQVRAGGQKLIFFATHFDHRHDEAERLASAGVLRELIAQHQRVPIVVAGDLNAVPDSRTLAALKEFLLDSSTAAPATESSYPADRPTERIDYVLYNQQPGWRCIECRVLPEAVASDHRPVLAVFEFGGRD